MKLDRDQTSALMLVKVRPWSRVSFCSSIVMNRDDWSGAERGEEISFCLSSKQTILSIYER